MKRASIVLAFLWVSVSPDRCALAQSLPLWNRLDILLGTWESAGDTQLGAGQGTAVFTRELHGQVMVRRSTADYTSGPQAGTHHDDLLIIYRNEPDGPPKAIYFDSEGHVIHYAVSSLAENAVLFQSDGSDPGPRYRLTYARVSARLNGTFEVAAPGGEFKTYLSWTSTRR